MEKNEIKILISEDGSHTLYRPDLDETYHSKKGAVAESRHVFIESGLDFISDKKKSEKLSVLEVGFGTGLNAFLTLLWAEDLKIEVSYHTLEPFPLKQEIYSVLNYPEQLAVQEKRQDFLRLHSASEGEKVLIGSHFFITKYFTTLENFSANISADVIFYDAFAPSKQKEVWSLENLLKCYTLLKPGGALVTYCANGQFKRDLKTAGFKMEVLSGPLGKKEMTRGLRETN